MLALWLQSSDAGTNSTLMIVFVGLVALAMVVQAVILVALGMAVMKALKSVLATVEEFKPKAAAIAESARGIAGSAQEIIRDVVPKVKVVTENVVEVSHVVRNQVAEFDATLSEANRKTQKQVHRVDGMVTSALNATAAMATTIHEGIQVPVRQMHKMVTSTKSGVDTLIAKFRSLGIPGVDRPPTQKGGW